jgi:hypothetical protein
MDMSWLAEMFFKILATRVDHITANFARVFLTQTVEFVEPEGDWFTVPSEGQFERVVNEIVCLTGIFIFVFDFDGGIESLILELL